MKHFVKNKIMGHFRSSEQQRKDAGQGSQADQSRGSQAEVGAKPRPAPQRSCPGSLNVPENMYVLKNCDRCQDYKVQPCNWNCKCRRRGSDCTGQCDLSPSLSQESIPEAATPSRSLLDPASQRRLGGNCPICQFCGREEIRQPGQSMCAQCNEKIQAAVDNYHVQCHGQCQPIAGQPCPYQQDQAHSQPGPQSTGQWQQFSRNPFEQQSTGQWQQLSGNPYDGQQPLGDQPFNIIVLQDCNNQSLIDQLTAAISRGGGQVHMPMEAHRSENNLYPNNYPNNYQSNPLAGYIDYEYVDPNRKEYGYEPERDDRYDYGYDMGASRRDSYYQRDGYEEKGFQNYASSYSFDYPSKHSINQKSEASSPDYTNQTRNQSFDYGQAQSCTCNCQFCRKAFETKDKLALLIAQALEIFIGRNSTKEDKMNNQEPSHKNENSKSADLRTKAKKKKARKSMSPEPVEKSPPKSKQESPEHGGNSPAKDTTKTHKESQLRTEKKGSKGKISSQSNQSTKTISNQGSGGKAVKHLGSVQNVSSRDAESSGSHKTPSFFLPNCEEHRCKHNCNGICSRKPHDCGKGCKSRCRGPCSKSGGGDGRSRRKGSGKGQRSHQRHTRCQQCNRGEGRQWQEVDATDCPAGNRNAGGSGFAKNALLGLSPIAHYRPGMLQFPVNYLLAGTNFRRRIVRTAAGVTLHQKPYLAKADAKDLPSFPCCKKCSSPDCRAPVKKWL